MAVEGQVAKPKRIKKTLEVGQKKWEEMYGKPEGEQPPQPQDPTPVAPEPVAATQPDPVPAPEQAVPPEPAPTPPQDFKTLYEKSLEESKSLRESLDTEKQKFSTLQGKYNAEVPRMKFQIDTLMAQLEKEQKAPPPTQPQPQDTGNGKEKEWGGKLKEFKETYPDMFDYTMSLAEEIAEKKVSELKKSMPQKQNPAVEETQRSMAYYDALSREVPEWTTVNNTPEFAAFLHQAEPFGRTKYDLLMDAFSRFDVKGSAYFFKEFLKAKNPPAPIPQAEPPKAEPPASIPRGSSTPPPSQNRGPVYTRADLAKLYEDKRKGLYKNKEPEFKALELKITKFLTRAPA